MSNPTALTMNTCERQRVITAETPKRSECHAEIAARTGRRLSRTVVLCGVALALGATLVGCTIVMTASTPDELYGVDTGMSISKEPQ